jgi:hypothetical protein
MSPVLSNRAFSLWAFPALELLFQLKSGAGPGCSGLAALGFLHE